MSFDLRRLLGLETPCIAGAVSEAAHHKTLQQFQPRQPMQLRPNVLAASTSASPMQFNHQQANGMFPVANDAQEFPDIQQGGQFNPGFTPMQGSDLQAQNAPQPATFNPLQQANYNPHRPGIFF